MLVTVTYLEMENKTIKLQLVIEIISFHLNFV